MENDKNTLLDKANENQNEQINHPGEETTKTYTQSEVDSAISKAVDSHSKKLHAKFEKLLQEELSKAESEETPPVEPEKEEKLSPFDIKLKELDEKEKAINRRIRVSEIYEELEKAKLPTVLAEYMADEDPEYLTLWIASFKKQWDQLIKEKVDGILNRGTSSKKKVD